MKFSCFYAFFNLPFYNLFLIVHCSAGVGRTGCFIVIDAMLERIKHEKTVDIYGHVTVMRAQRNYMVQTEDQYVFIHDALQEAVNCGTTEVPARNLYAYIQKLTQIEGGENVTGMELEFKVQTVDDVICIYIVFPFFVTFSVPSHQTQFGSSRLHGACGFIFFYFSPLACVTEHDILPLIAFPFHTPSLSLAALVLVYILKKLYVGFPYHRHLSFHTVN